jgi:DNA-binding transcriptional LysR family regulator
MQPTVLELPHAPRLAQLAGATRHDGLRGLHDGARIEDREQIEGHRTDPWACRHACRRRADLAPCRGQRSTREQPEELTSFGHATEHGMRCTSAAASVLHTGNAILHGRLSCATMLDWDDLRFFLAVARHRTMSKAARALRVAQPTVGRRIAAFERRLGSRLFLRASTGWVLSPAGQGMFAHAEEMEAQALAAENLASGRDAGLNGEVRITASEWMIATVVGPRLAPLMARHPALSVDLVAEARHLNLFRREADIAIRPSKFQQVEIFQRAVAVIQFGLYASDDYLARLGKPDFSTKGEGHTLVAADAGMGTTIVDITWLPPLLGNARVAARTNGRLGMASLAAAGIGIACLPRSLGDATSGLRLLRTSQAGPRRQLWMGVHRAARAVERVKAVTNFLADGFAHLREVLDPRP